LSENGIILRASEQLGGAMNAIDLQQISVFLATGTCICLVFPWMAVHGWGLIKLLGMEDKSASGKAVGAWALSFVGGFTGPCVILASLVAFFIAGGEAKKARWGDANEATAHVAKVARLSSAIILLMAALMSLFVLGGQAFAPT